jgi:hypothetical protein
MVAKLRLGLILLLSRGAVSLKLEDRTSSRQGESRSLDFQRYPRDVRGCEVLEEGGNGEDLA